MNGRPDLRRRVAHLVFDDRSICGGAVHLALLQEHFDLPAAGDSSSLMALDRAISRSGGRHGAVTGVTSARGLLPKACERAQAVPPAIREAGRQTSPARSAVPIRPRGGCPHPQLTDHPAAAYRGRAR